MRFIPGNNETEQSTRNNYNSVSATLRMMNGFIAEHLICDYCHGPGSHVPAGPDAGYDLMIDGFTVDVKTTTNDIQYFDYPNTNGIVNSNHGLRADIYLFTKIDPNNRKLAIIGYLGADEIPNKGIFCKKGDLLPNGVIKSRLDCFVVSQEDIHLVNE